MKKKKVKKNAVIKCLPLQLFFKIEKNIFLFFESLMLVCYFPKVSFDVALLLHKCPLHTNLCPRTLLKI